MAKKKEKVEISEEDKKKLSQIVKKAIYLYDEVYSDVIGRLVKGMVAPESVVVDMKTALQRFGAGVEVSNEQVEFGRESRRIYAELERLSSDEWKENLKRVAASISEHLASVRAFQNCFNDESHDNASIQYAIELFKLIHGENERVPKEQRGKSSAKNDVAKAVIERVLKNPSIFIGADIEASREYLDESLQVVSNINYIAQVLNLYEIDKSALEVYYSFDAVDSLKDGIEKRVQEIVSPSWGHLYNIVLDTALYKTERVTYLQEVGALLTDTSITDVEREKRIRAISRELLTRSKEVKALTDGFAENYANYFELITRYMEKWKEYSETGEAIVEEKKGDRLGAIENILIGINKEVEGMQDPSITPEEYNAIKHSLTKLTDVDLVRAILNRGLKNPHALHNLLEKEIEGAKTLEEANEIFARHKQLVETCLNEIDTDYAYLVDLYDRLVGFREVISGLMEQSRHANQVYLSKFNPMSMATGRSYFDEERLNSVLPTVQESMDEMYDKMSMFYEQLPAVYANTLAEYINGITHDKRLKTRTEDIVDLTHILEGAKIQSIQIAGTKKSLATVSLVDFVQEEVAGNNLLVNELSGREPIRLAFDTKLARKRLAAIIPFISYQSDLLYVDLFEKKMSSTPNTRDYFEVCARIAEYNNTDLSHQVYVGKVFAKYIQDGRLDELLKIRERIIMHARHTVDSEKKRELQILATQLSESYNRWKQYIILDDMEGSNGNLPQ